MPFPPPVPSGGVDSYNASAPKPKDPTSLEAIAVRAVGDSRDRPCIIRFVNGRTLTADLRKDKPLAKAIQDSQGLVALFDSMDQDLSMTARMFRLVSVEVSGVEAKDSPAVNATCAPVVAVLDAEGKLVKAMGPGMVRKNELMAAMAQALKARIPLEKLLLEEKAIMREIFDIENLKATLESKRTQARTAKGPSVQRLETEIQALQAKVSERETALREREAKLYGRG